MNFNFGNLKALGVAAVIAMTPMAASAVTIAPGDTVDVLGGFYEFEEDIAIGTPGATKSFTFENSSSSVVAVTLFQGTILQLSAAFENGVDIMFGSYYASIAQGMAGFFGGSINIAPGASEVLSITFGKVLDTGEQGQGKANIDFAVEASVVPLPAAGFLLIGAIGGLAALRRRKTTAMV